MAFYWTFLVVFSTIGWVRGWSSFLSFSKAKPSLILFSLLIMTDVVPLSALFSIMALSYMWQLFESFLLTGCERFLKPRKAELVDSSQISHKMDVAHFLYRNICTWRRIRLTTRSKCTWWFNSVPCYCPELPSNFFYMVCPLLPPRKISPHLNDCIILSDTHLKMLHDKTFAP